MKNGRCDVSASDFRTSTAAHGQRERTKIKRTTRTIFSCRGGAATRKECRHNLFKIASVGKVRRTGTAGTAVHLTVPGSSACREPRLPVQYLYTGRNPAGIPGWNRDQLPAAAPEQAADWSCLLQPRFSLQQWVDQCRVHWQEKTSVTAVQ